MINMNKYEFKKDRGSRSQLRQAPLIAADLVRLMALTVWIIKIKNINWRFTPPDPDWVITN